GSARSPACPRSSLLQRSGRAPAGPCGSVGTSARRGGTCRVPGVASRPRGPSKEKHDPPAGRVRLTVTRCNGLVVLFRRTVRVEEEFHHTHLRRSAMIDEVSGERGRLASV